MSENTVLIRPPNDAIVRIRGQAVILDSDLAALYGVTVKRLNEQVRRNQKRFPDDFVLRLTESEWDSLRSQFATLKRGQHRKYMPYAFTEHGAIMAATVLNSQKAIDMSVAVVRAFVRLRRLALSVEGLARKVAALENKYDASFRAVFDAVRDLMEPQQPPRKRIGFHAEHDRSFLLLLPEKPHFLFSCSMPMFRPTRSERPLAAVPVADGGLP